MIITITLTLMNENYTHPERPDSAKDELIMKGGYKIETSENPDVRILASGVTVRFVLAASNILKNKGINSEVWSITSFNELARGGIEC